MKKTTTSVLWFLVFVLTGATGPVQGNTWASETWGHRPLAFEENRGQSDPAVQYLVRGGGHTLFLTSEEAVIVLHGGDPSGSLLRMRWMDARSGRPTAEGQLPGVTHFLAGSDPSRWRTGVPSWSRIRYEEAWPGIDMVFYGNPHQLENDMIVRPGADPRRVRLAFEGADDLRIDAGGDLVARVGAEELRWRRPVSFQEVDGVRAPVESAWRLLPGKREAGFRVGSYDRSRPLVIDPVLVYATTLGGRGGDMVHGMTVDGTGNAYVVGETSLDGFPGAGKPARSYDAFVSKLAPDGSLIFTTLFGGSQIDVGLDIALDQAGVLHVVGVTQSPDFPQIQPLPAAFQGDSAAAILVRLDPSGAILSSTRLGGTGYEEALDLELDSTGAIYLAGITNSWNFPTVGGLQTSFGGGPYDAFVAKIAPGAESLVWATYLGGSGSDGAQALALGPAGSIVVVGATRSPGFPTPPGGPSVGSQPSPEDYHAFVTRLAPAGTAIVYTAFLGGKAGASGSLGTAARDVALDAAGAAYVSGYTYSPEFPVLGGLNTTLNGYADAFVTKLSPAGSLVWSTLLGGSHGEGANAIALDAAGNINLAGATDSTDFPLLDPLQATCLPHFGDPANPMCFSDVFITRLAPDASSILFSTYWGGTLDVPDSGPADSATAISVGPHGTYVAGVARSLDFPVFNPLQPAYGGGLGDGFVLRIAPENLNAPPVCSAATASPPLLWPPNNRMAPVSIRGVTDPDGNPVTITVTGVRQDEPLSGKGANASGIGTATVSLRADRAGNGDGRVYHLTFTAEDPLGASCTGEVTVCVPHDQRRRTCVDGGPVFRSH
jgi:hypothetical protein